MDDNEHAIILGFSRCDDRVMSFQIKPEKMLAGFRQWYHVEVTKDFRDGMDRWALHLLN